jgi:hypothetical protein
MKVKIGPYTTWVGPFQIAEKLIFWADKYECTPWGERQHRLGTWLAKDKNGDDSWLMKFCNWIHSCKKRQEYVHIDNYDVWNMDSTLHLIIGPMFKKLKEVKNGFGMIADEDVPEALRSTNAPAKENEWDWDDLAEKRYEWLLDEMIWAFCADHDEAQHKFYDHGEKIKGEDLMASIARMKVDREGLDAYNKRLENAYRLFGKYYQTFWD